MEVTVSSSQEFQLECMCDCVGPPSEELRAGEKGSLPYCVDIEVSRLQCGYSPPEGASPI